MLGGGRGLALLNSVVSFAGALVSVWTMQRTTAQSDWSTLAGRVLWLQRIMLALAAVSFALNVVTPFITPDPPWLSQLPMAISVTMVLLIYGLWYKPDFGGHSHRNDPQE
jgi:peptidoglycan/LPS O-acetylase OafA/YrhL